MKILWNNKSFGKNFNPFYTKQTLVKIQCYENILPHCIQVNVHLPATYNPAPEHKNRRCLAKLKPAMTFLQGLCFKFFVNFFNQVHKLWTDFILPCWQNNNTLVVFFFCISLLWETKHIKLTICKQLKHVI